METEIEDVMH